MQKMFGYLMLSCISFVSFSFASEQKALTITHEPVNHSKLIKEQLLKKPEMNALVFNMGNFDGTEEYLEKCALKGPLPNIIIEKASTQDLSSLLKQLEKLSKNGIKSENILVILDLHGTISVEPSHLYNYKPTPKKNVINQIKIIKEEFKVQPFLCSAWEAFSEILQDVKNLGIGELFSVKNQDIKLQTLKNENYSIVGYQNGYVVSAKFMSSKNIYFRRKGLAPLLHDKDGYQNITHVLLADDSAQNLSYLTDDLLQYRPAPYLQEIYLLDTEVDKEEE